MSEQPYGGERRQSDAVAIGRLQGTLETFIEAQRIHNGRVEGSLDDLQKSVAADFSRVHARITGIETKSASVGGVAGALISAAITVAGVFLNGKN
jgi:hypothetical protein